jgi:small subunit ribosomal protein S6
MKCYEIVLIVDPSCSEQADEMLKRYQTSIEEKEGKIVRMENWGRRKLAYSIGKNHKAHFLFLGIEGTAQIMEVVNGLFRYNDALLRTFVTKVKSHVSSKTAMRIAEEMQDGSKDDLRKAIRDCVERYDYKNPFCLKKYILESGRIIPNRVTGLTARQQRDVSKAIKVARYLSLLPYCDRHI